MLQWGDLSFTGETLSDFEGVGKKEVKNNKLTTKEIFKSGKELVQNLMSGNSERKLKDLSSVNSRDAELSYLYTLYNHEPTSENGVLL